MWSYYWFVDWGGRRNPRRGVLLSIFFSFFVMKQGLCSLPPTLPESLIQLALPSCSPFRSGTFCKSTQALEQTLFLNPHYLFTLESYSEWKDSITTQIYIALEQGEDIRNNIPCFGFIWICLVWAIKPYCVKVFPVNLQWGFTYPKESIKNPNPCGDYLAFTTVIR